MPPVEQQQSNKKGIIYVVLLVLILLIVSGIWYVKQSKAAKAFSYQDVVYDCQETGGVAVEVGTVIRMVQTTDGTPIIVHQGKEYKCAIITDGSKAPDVVLDKVTDDVKLFVSDESGNEVEVEDGSVKVDAEGNAVIVNEKGVRVELEDGGLIEVSEEGDVNVNLPGTGSVKVKGEDVETNIPGTGSVKTEGGTTNINTPETGNIKVDEEGGVTVPGVDIPNY